MGFIPVIAAVAVLMFSLEPAPAPLDEPVSTPAFEATDAARLARTIAQTAPDRTPGSQGDEAIAGLVRERFSGITGGVVAEQTFETSFDGEDVETQNVVLSIPGENEEALLVLAPRDTVEGDGATTSASATATLLTIAEALGNTRHNRTIVLASTSGSGDGAKGVRELIGQLDIPGGVTAAITIAHPGVEEREPPFIYAGHAGPDSIPPVLWKTAHSIASNQFDTDAAPAGAWSAYARMAFPVGVGEATALADEGIDAVGVSGSGERPPEPLDADGARISTETLLAAGTTTLDLLLTLDASDKSIAKGDQEYVRLGSNVIPGWTFELLALALLIPSLLAGVDVWLRDRRRNPRPTRRSVPWTLERILLPLAALLVAYVLGLTGLIPSPDFPYDPSAVDPGAAAPVAFGIMLLAMILVALLVRPMRTPLDAEPQTLAAASGVMIALGLVGLWFVNPFLTLLLTPTAHVWLLPARPQGPPRPRTIALVALVSLLPAAAAFAKVASDLGLGLLAPWHVLLLLVDGHTGPLTALLWCVVIGGLFACIGAAGAAKPPESGPVRGTPGSVRGPSGYAGPGSLGGTPSSLPRV